MDANLGERLYVYVIRKRNQTQPSDKLYFSYEDAFQSIMKIENNENDEYFIDAYEESLNRRDLKLGKSSFVSLRKMTP